MSIFEALADPLPDRFFQSRLGFEHFNTFRKQIPNASARQGGTLVHPELQTAYVISMTSHPEILRPHAAVRKCPFGATNPSGGRLSDVEAAWKSVTLQKTIRTGSMPQIRM